MLNRLVLVLCKNGSSPPRTINLNSKTTKRRAPTSTHKALRHSTNTEHIDPSLKYFGPRLCTGWKVKKHAKKIWMRHLNRLR